MASNSATGFSETKAAIFDIDGTLVDSVDLHAECWREALAHFGIQLPFEAMRAQIGKGGELLPAFVVPDDLARRGKQIERAPRTPSPSAIRPTTPRPQDGSASPRSECCRAAFPKPICARAGCVAIYRSPADLLARFPDLPLAKMPARSST
jgi:Haloacid dehalogenase-like hydrolase